MKKKILSVCISLLCLINVFSALSVDAETQAFSVAGDISGNGKIDIYDAIEISKYIIGVRKFSYTEIVAADYNKDGFVNLYDAIGIAEYIIKNTKPSQSTSQSNYAAAITNLVNKERSKKNIAKVKMNSTLSNAAALRAKEIAKLFSHDRPDGSSCFTVLGEYGLSYSCVAENIAAGNATPEGTMNQWINSQGHYENLMSPDVTEIGVGYYYDSNSAYKYYWVQLFRKP